jgi:hypothetical protein
MQCPGSWWSGALLCCDAVSRAGLFGFQPNFANGLPKRPVCWSLGMTTATSCRARRS